MAEESREERSREDLTEEASPYRIEEFRRKGMVAQSREVSGLIALCAVAVTLYLLTPQIGSSMAEFMREVFRTDLSARADLAGGAATRGFLQKALSLLISICLPIGLAGFVLGILGSFAQIGAIFSTDPLQPDLSKVNPIQGFKRMFSLRQLIDGARMVFKFCMILIVAYVLVKSKIFEAKGYLGTEPVALFGAYGHTAKVIFFSLFAVLAVFAGLDYWQQRWEYGKKVRMTKQEAKQEHKEREGDPHIKARIRSVQREIARRRMMQAVKKADVVVTNPTHIAVAIVYEKNKMAAPKVVAKGADFLAQRIKAIAQEAGVPMVENVPLARTLFKSVKVGQFIPRNLYQAVAEVLAYVYRLRKKDFN